MSRRGRSGREPTAAPSPDRGVPVERAAPRPGGVAQRAAQEVRAALRPFTIPNGITLLAPGTHAFLRARRRVGRPSGGPRDLHRGGDLGRPRRAGGATAGHALAPRDLPGPHRRQAVAGDGLRCSHAADTRFSDDPALAHGAGALPRLPDRAGRPVALPGRRRAEFPPSLLGKATTFIHVVTIALVLIANVTPVANRCS